MATSPLAQIAATSIDIAGISVCTASASPSDPRAGSVYNLTDLAAASPIWFHPISDGRYLMINSRRWHTATSAGNPGVFSDYTEDNTPSWAIVDGPTGRHSPVPGFVTSIPTNKQVSSRVVTAAASRPTELLFLLSSIDEGALLQRFHVRSDGAVTIAAEEILPTLGSQIVFDQGIRYTSVWIYVYGTSPSGKIYVIRKSWAHVGVNKLTVTNQRHYNVASTPQGWEYFTGKGYSLDSAESAPMPDITTDGPMSFASYRNVLLITTVKENLDGTYVGLVWRSNSSRPFTRVGDPVPLGDGASYLGGGIQMMPQLQSVATVSSAAIPYVISIKTVFVDASESLVNTWALWPIQL